MNAYEMFRFTFEMSFNITRDVKMHFENDSRAT